MLESQCNSYLCGCLPISSGGHPDKWQLVKYNILDDVFVDYGVGYLNDTLGNSQGELGFGIHFSQINETTLFTMNIPESTSFGVYNLETLSYQDLNIDRNFSAGDCMASSQVPSPRLYITGDWDVFLDLDEMKWKEDMPWMNEWRWGHGCMHCLIATCI